MTDEHLPSPCDAADRLDEAIASFEEARDAGLNPDPAEWLARYSDVADQLAKFLADDEKLRRLTDPASSDGRAESVPLPEDYQLLQTIGPGGMGIVYKVWQRSSKRVVALKLIRPDRLEGVSPEQRRRMIERFVNEAQAAAQLGHDHIVSVYEVGEINGQPFYSMRYVEGVSLQELIEVGPLECRRAATYLECVARGIHDAHQHAILHRDLKPANILIEARSDRALVADFGLAKLTNLEGVLTVTGELMGTPPYMSPEQALNSARVTVASDVYSLGATLYAALTGSPPFHSDNPVETLRQVMHESPIPPRQRRPDIPRDLETICLKCLRKEPDKRYASALALAEDLQLFLAGEPILGRPLGRLERGYRWCRRNLAVATLMAVVATLLVAAAVGSTLGAIRIASDHEALVVARDEEASQRKRAEKLAAEGQQRVAQLCVANGERLRGNGDELGALIWYAEALKEDNADLLREDTHRVRVATALRQTPQLLQLWTHDLPLYHVQFSPDGQSLVVTCGEPDFVGPARGEAHVYDTVTGKEVFPTLKHSLPVHHASFSRDGLRLVTACGGSVKTGPGVERLAGEARVWDARTGRPLTKALEHETWVKQATLSPDGRHLITLCGVYNGLSEAQAQVWDLKTEKPAGPAVKSKGTLHLSLDSAVRLLAVSTTFEDAQVLDVFTGQPLTPRLKHSLKQVKGGSGFQADVIHIAFSPDGQRVVTASGDDTARVWDAITGQPVTPPMKHNDKVNHAAFSPDGKRVITASDDETARLWDAATGEPASALIKLSGHVTYAAFSPDGRRVVTTSFEQPARPSGTTGYQMVRVWDAATATPVSPVFRHVGIARVVFSPDGRRLVTAGLDGVVKLWDLTEEPAKLSFDRDTWVGTAAVSRDGRHLVTKALNGTATVWDLAGGQPVPLARKLSGYVKYLTFSRDGRLVLTANGSSPYGPFKFGTKDSKVPDQQPDQQQAQVWDSATGKPLGTPLRHDGQVLHAEFSSDGSRVVTASQDGTARVWDAATGEPVTPPLPHGAYAVCASFSPDGRRVVTVSQGGTARVWDAATGEVAGPVLQPGRWTNYASFSPEGLQILTDGFDRTARLWDTATGKLLGMPLKHGGHMTRSFFDKGGCRILVVLDQEARVWDVSRGEPITPLLKHGNQVNWAVFNPDGRRVVTASQDGTARVWDAATGEPVTTPLHCGRAGAGTNWRFSLHSRNDVPQAHFSPDGRRLITVDWKVVQNWDLRPDERPAEDLVRVAVVLSGRQVDKSGGDVPVGKDVLADAWKSLQAKYPGQFRNSGEETLERQKQGGGSPTSQLRP
jgi:WD40 repeat protein